MINSNIPAVILRLATRCYFGVCKGLQTALSTSPAAAHLVSCNPMHQVESYDSLECGLRIKSVVKTGIRLLALSLLLGCMVLPNSCNWSWLSKPVGAASSANEAAASGAGAVAPDSAATGAGAGATLGQGLLMLVAVDLTTSMTPRWLNKDLQAGTPKLEQTERSREIAIAKAMQLASAAPPEVKLLILAYADRSTWHVFYGPAKAFKAQECVWPQAPRGSVSNHQLPAQELLKFLSIEERAPFVLYWISDFVPTGGSGSAVTTRKYGEPRLPSGMPATELLTHPRLLALTLLQVELDQATQLKAALKQAHALEPEIRLDGQTEGFTPPARLIKQVMSGAIPETQR